MNQWLLENLLGLEDAAQVTYFEWQFRSPWPSLLAVGLVVAAVAAAVWLYRRQGALSRPRRVALTTCRAVVLALIVLMLFEPVFGAEVEVKLRRLVLLLLDTSESMEIQDRRETEPDLRGAAVAAGYLDGAEATATLTDAARRAVADLSRIDLARAALTNRHLALIDRLGDQHKLRMFTFADALEPVPTDDPALTDRLESLTADGQATRLGGAIDQAIGRFAGQPIAGVIVLTDGGSNKGVDALEAAGGAADLGVPIYPVGIGLPDPPDIVARRIIVQEVVFPEDRVPVRVQIQSAGFAGRSADLVLTLDGREMARQSVALTGGTQFEQLEFTPDENQAGVRQLEVAIDALDGETSIANNRLDQPIRIVDQKIKVLYVEGKPRWEYRYLRAVLLRDHRLDTTFLMTEGDEDLADFSPMYIDRFPVEAGEAFAYDLVILGDVPAYFFSPLQLETMQRLVREHAGSLLMIAGRRHAPHTYAGTSIEPLLPVRLMNQPRPPTMSVMSDVHPVATEQAEASSVTLEPDPARNAEVWSLVRPMHELPRLAGAKPGATVLLKLSTDPAEIADSYPLVSWHRYGSGKSMMVGTDALWRLRFKRGDQYHARFWRQTIQFLTLSRLLSGSNRITIETDRRSYRTGQQVAVYANVLDDVWQPIDAPSYTVYLRREGEPTRRPVKLEPVPDRPGLYQGAIGADEAGNYTVTASAADQPAANEAGFTVQTVALEQRDPAMQQATLMKMAERTGGRYVDLGDLGDLPEALSVEQQTAVQRVEKDLWDLPALYVLITVLVGAEWYLRRRSNLV